MDNLIPNPYFISQKYLLKKAKEDSNTLNTPLTVSGGPFYFPCTGRAVMIKGKTQMYNMALGNQTYLHAYKFQV